MRDTPSVLLFGSVPLEDSMGVDTTVVDTVAAVPADTSTPDCVVVAATVGQETVSAVADRWPNVPLLYYDEDPDGVVASAVTGRGATEYVVPESLGGQSLADRVTAAVAKQRDGSETSHDRADQTLERIDDAFFALDDDWQIVYMNDEAKRALAGTFADWVDEDNVVGSNAWEAAPAAVDTPFFDAFHRALETQESVEFEEYYEPLDVWFAVRVYPSETGLSIYFSDVTERKRREEALSGLLEASQALMSATSAEEIADQVGRAAADILGYPANAVRLYDAETDLLYPVAVTERTREIMGSREPYPPGDGFTGRAFAAGEPQYTPDGSELGGGPAFEDIGALYAHPLGDHGVLTVGTTVVDDIDETDRTLVDILAATATAAFDAAEREASLRRYRAVYEHASEMVLVTDHEGTVTLVTEPLAERLGESSASLVGGDLEKLFHPEGAERGQTAPEALRQTEGRRRVFETRLRGEDGGIPVEVEVSLLPTEEPAPDSAVLVVRDITELARTRTELADERVRFEQLFERSPDAIVDVAYEDSTPVVRAVNEAFEETFGYDVDRVVGADLNEFVAPENDGSAPLLDERMSAGSDIAREVQRTTADGERDFIFRGVPYDDDGSTPRAFGIYTDITEQKRRERRLLVFDRMLRHNLRNEATTILGFTGELQRTLDGEPARWAERANTAARNLAESSEHVRWVQRALDSDVPGTPAGLASLVADVLADAREESPEATLRADVPEGFEVSDGRLLEVALEELVENALQHSDREAPTVEVTATPTLRAQRNTLAVRVHDDGPGIPERERAVLTDEREITQLDHSRGLGLWLARWATQGLGGRLSFEEGGDGATVVLEVPVTGGNAPEETERGEAGN